MFNLTKRKPVPKHPEYKVPIINLSSHQLTETKYRQLKFGLNHSFINKDKNVKKDIATHMEPLVYILHRKNQKTFNQKTSTNYNDIFAKNVLNSEDFTCKNLKSLKQDENIVIILGDKDSRVVIMDKSDYIQKLEDMIEEGISKGTYEGMNDTTLQDLKRFQDFLYRNSYNYQNYHKMYPHSNQPAKKHGTTKTHKFKACVCIFFYKIFIFHQMVALQKL